MNLSFPINCQFLDQLYRKYFFFSQEFKITNESWSILIHKLSFDILIQILVTNNISQYL